MAHNSQIKSRSRIQEHGEVYTSEYEVNSMLGIDMMIKSESERIDSRFLEPACGTGNFLIEILRRKLRVVDKRYRKNQSDYERNAFVAVSSIYGIDILEDNVTECRQNLFNLFDSAYTKLYRNRCDDTIRKSISYVLDLNIVCGDALTFETSSKKPIVFPEWSMVSDALVKRRDFEFSEILRGHDSQPLSEKNSQQSLSCFINGTESIQEEKHYFPTPIADYPLLRFSEIWKND